MNKFTEITSSSQLSKILKMIYDNPSIKGKVKFDTHVIGIDQLKEIKHQKNQIIIINFQKSTQVGSHWVMVVCKGDEVVYVDSFGLPPPEPVLRFMKEYKTKKLVKSVLMTTKRVQKMEEELCGYYLMNFLSFYLLKGLPAYLAVNKLTYTNTKAYGKKLFNQYLN